MNFKTINEVVINESGVYDLILSSKLPTARKFCNGYSISM